MHIGNYDVVEQIGAGAMGVVYKVRHRIVKRKRDLALKIINPAYAKNAVYRERFQREIRAVGELDHPNIINVLDAGEHEGNPFFVMEYLNGQSLETWIDEKRPLDLAQKLRIAAAVCRGLGYAHQQGIVHRDLKPQNIIVVSPDLTPKILDFGVAHIAGHTITQAGTRIGTVSYMSPEQLNGEEVDARSDIFSTAVVLYELIAGQAPFTGRDAGSTMKRILMDPAPPLFTFIELYPPMLESVLQRALAKRPVERYATAEEFAQDLEKARNIAGKQLQGATNVAETRIVAPIEMLPAAERRRIKQLEVISAFAQQTTAVLDLDELLTVVCRLILEWFETIDHVAVLLRETENLRVRAYEGRLTTKVPLGALLPQGKGIASRALAQNHSIIENDVSSVDGYFPGFSETQSEVCVPLIFFGEKLGVLALDSAKKDAFQAEDVQLLESVGDMCAVAIQNANYFERMRHLAYVDHLTGIHNRRYFEMRIVEELERAQRFDGRISLIMVDIDYFRHLIDEFGHILGDDVLRDVAGILKNGLRKADLISRYGGEEFAIIIPETTGENALTVAELLRRRVGSHPLPGVPRPVTISCGVAEFPTHGTTRDELVAAADAALQVAQQSGRDRVALASA
jgi:diguanylate cyclase (GGDEF)-like protein